MKTGLLNKISGFNKLKPLRVIALVLIGVIAAGCSDKKTEMPEKSAKVTVRGSNTVGEELAPMLVAGFKKVNPAADFDMEFKGTGYGFGNLLYGGCDIAAASRAPDADEQAVARERNLDFNEYTIGSYSVAVVVNAGNSVTNLTKEQVRDIFTGAVQNWKDVGGPDAPIHLYVRDPISGTYLGFRELAMENKPYALTLQTCTNYAAIIAAVVGDTNGIGYSSIELASASGVRGLLIGGTSPTADAVNKGEYPYMRVLHFYTNKADESSATHDFIQFVLSPDGQKIVGQMGDVPRS